MNTSKSDKQVAVRGAGGAVACGGRAAVIGLRWPGGCDWPAVAGRVSRGLRWPAPARGLCGLRWPAAGGCATICKATIYKATGRQSNGAPSEQRRAPSRRWGLLATMPRAHRSARRYTRRRAEGLPKGRQAATEGEPGGRAGGVVACGGRRVREGFVACGGRRRAGVRRYTRLTCRANHSISSSADLKVVYFLISSAVSFRILACICKVNSLPLKLCNINGHNNADSETVARLANIKH